MVRSMQVSLGLPDPRDSPPCPAQASSGIDSAERTQLQSGSILGVPNVINSELEPTPFLGAQFILSAQSQPLLITLPSVALVRSHFPVPTGLGGDEGMVGGPVTCDVISNGTTTTPVGRSKFPHRGGHHCGNGRGGGCYDSDSWPLAECCLRAVYGRVNTGPPVCSFSKEC